MWFLNTCDKTWEKYPTENTRFTVNRYFSGNIGIVWNCLVFWTKPPFVSLKKTQQWHWIQKWCQGFTCLTLSDQKLKEKKKGTKTWGERGVRKIISLATCHAQQSSNTMLLMTFRQCQNPFDCIFKPIFLQNFPAFIRKLPCLTKLSLGFNIHVLLFTCLFFAC